MTTVLRGRVITEQGILDNATITFGAEHLDFVGETGHDRPTVDLPDDVLLLPGLVDSHCHGGGGGEFGPDPDSARRAATYHHRAGSTTVIASLVSATPDILIAGMHTCAALASDGLLAGTHTEGPFLAYARRGAQDPQALQAVDLDLVDRLAVAGRGHWRMMTYAPELIGTQPLITHLASLGVRPAIGHTDGTAATTRQALAEVHRATGMPAIITHLFNGMPPFHHRSPGPAGAALAAAASGRAVIELVADGVHLAEDTVAIVSEVAADHTVVLITDAMAACGMPDGPYQLGRLSVVVADGAARLDDDDGALAGGVATLLDVVRHCVTSGAMPLLSAVAAASWVPARTHGLELVGSLSPGKFADVLAVDTDMNLLAVWRRGRRITHRP